MSFGSKTIKVLLHPYELKNFDTNIYSPTFRTIINFQVILRLIY